MPMSRWQELFERQHEEERDGTADPGTHGEERTNLREKLEKQQQDDSDDEDDHDEW